MIAYREEMPPAESISKQMGLKTALQLWAETTVSLNVDDVTIFEYKLGWNRVYTLAPFQGTGVFYFTKK